MKEETNTIEPLMCVEEAAPYLGFKSGRQILNIIKNNRENDVHLNGVYEMSSPKTNRFSYRILVTEFRENFKSEKRYNIKRELACQ